MSDTERAEAAPASDPGRIYDAMQAEIGRVLVGNEQAVEQLTVALLTRGHVLLEGVPGVGKTTLASLFARVTGLDHRRIQMTPDILPADITGTHVYREQTGEFELQRGPVFANLVVADEINRATPKTQSALLEAMQERHVTIEGETLSLPEPFMVVATQNPIEMEGVFELPEAQRDRFQLKISIDLPDREDERELVERFDADPELDRTKVDRVVGPEEIMAAREQVGEIYIATKVKEYILDLVAATREHANVHHGASPRASIAFVDAAKARAAINGRSYVTPTDVKSLVQPVLAHRLVLSTEAELREVTPQDIVAGVLESIATPSGSISPS